MVSKMGRIVSFIRLKSDYYLVLQSKTEDGTSNVAYMLRIDRELIAISRPSMTRYMGWDEMNLIIPDFVHFMNEKNIATFQYTTGRPLKRGSHSKNSIDSILNRTLPNGIMTNTRSSKIDEIVLFLKTKPIRDKKQPIQYSLFDTTRRREKR